MALCWIVVSVCLGVTASAAAGSSALFGVRTAHAFLPPPFGADDVEHGRTHDKKDHRDGYVINDTHRSCFEGILSLELLVLAENHGGEYGGDGQNDHPTNNGHPSRTEATARK